MAEDPQPENTLGELTRAVQASFDGASDDRFRTVLQALVRHLHAFVGEVGLTEAEWALGIDFLTRTGQLSGPARQEFILLSDVLGVSMATVAVNHPGQDAGVTESTVLGPFFVEGSPRVELGADISGAASGEPCYVAGTVRGTDGSPVPGARIELWESDEDGFYDVQYEGGPVANRAHLFTDAGGGYRFWSVRPAPYPIPHDGPVGELLTAAGRGPMRPAHIHFLVTAPGYRTLTTHVFAAGDPCLGSDAVFGVKDSLIAEFRPQPAGPGPERRLLAAPWWRLDFDLVLAEVRPAPGCSTLAAMPPAARTPRPRSYDRMKSRAALTAQAAALRGAVALLCADPEAERLLAGPTRLGDWRVRELVAHLGSVFDSLTDNLGLPPGDAAPIAPTDWVAATRTGAPAIAEYARDRGAAEFGGAPAEVAAALDRAVDRALKLLAEDLSPELRLPIRFGPMLLDDYLVTRMVETVVHADDLAAALPTLFATPDAFPHDRHALASATRVLADSLAAQAPGGSVELRIPPFAVVQCVAGPRHTRGTPPNVVETAPLPWIRLATGRTTWARATGAEGEVAQLTASGERSDLSPLLPVMG